MRRSSPAHPQAAEPNGAFSLDLVRCLREPETRDRTGLFLAEGPRFLFSALDSTLPITGAVLSPKFLPDGVRHMAVARLRAAGIPFLMVSPQEFGEVSPAEEPGGALVVARQHWQDLPTTVGPRDLWLAVDHLRTSGNVGTLIRSLAAAGGKGLMVFGPARDRTDPFDPLAVRASMGALFGQQIVRTTHQEFRRWRLRAEVTVLGATGDADTDYRRVSYRRPVVLMLGNERSGLSDAQRETCDGFVRIPMAPGVDSLNVAMAGTVLLFEVFGQRHPVKRA